ncbi:hypothetical protein FGF1_13870 [Flavobacteriaceae bacterium GF1]
MDKPRPIPLQKELLLKNMTWMEIRDLIKQGYTTVIIGTGGLEMNGPYMVTDKHNIIMENLAKGIASQLGNTLVATIVPYVPQGHLKGPSGLLRYPGTLGVSQQTFQHLVRDIAISLKHHGFTEIILLGDSGGNQKGLKTVSEELNRDWQGKPVVRYIPEYFDYEKWIGFQERYGIFEVSEGIHDIFRDTALLLLDDSNHIRKKQRLKNNLFTVNGIDLTDTIAIKRIGHALFDFQVGITRDAIELARKND